MQAHWRFWLARIRDCGKTAVVRKRKGIAIFFLLAIVVSVAGLYLARPRGPMYQGRSLRSWLAQLDDGQHDNGLMWESWTEVIRRRTAKQNAAAEAIRQMGTNSLPYLVQALTSRDSDQKIKIMLLLKKQSWIKVDISTAEEMRRPAALALDILGPAAEPYVPQLTDALWDKTSVMGGGHTSKAAAIALGAVGPEGWAVLRESLTRSNFSTIYGTWALGSRRVTEPGAVEALLAVVTNNINANGSEKALAAWSLGEIGQESERVVPVLIAALQSPDNDLRWSAADSLGKFGTNAQSSVPALVKALQDPNASVHNNALKSLKVIDPKTAESLETK
ncbi:MAG: repeat protein [Pedosphaera sp.]|nr:repeat protein [Pedosphaera sp.]